MRATMPKIRDLMGKFMNTAHEFYVNSVLGGRSADKAGFQRIRGIRP